MPADVAARKIILLSDGTGNTTAKVWRTNVWRMFEALNLSRPDQVAMYADGVGTSAFKPLAILGGAFGWGLKRNVLDLYKFACRQYQPGSDIYLFGFSRGAFTVRVVTGLMLNQGLVPYNDEADLDRRAKAAYRAYRAEKYHTILGVETPLRWLRDRFLPAYDKSQNRTLSSIRFIGVWDTVAAYGLPIEEMTLGVSRWLWPLELPDRKLDPRVQRACQALSLDDDRTTFHPVLWTEAGEAAKKPDGAPIARTTDERISQVWFAGAHSNVGGGYPDDRLAHLSLHWMMEEAAHCGLVFKRPPAADHNALLRAKSIGDYDGRIYEPRAGLGATYRYGPRNVAQLSRSNAADRKRAQRSVDVGLPKIHWSVLERIRRRGGYAPIGLPESYAVVERDGTISAPVSPGAPRYPDNKTRATAQKNVWDQVWKRRVVYFLSVAAAMNLLLFPFIYDIDKTEEFRSPLRIVSEILRFASSFLPGVAMHWINAFAAHYWMFLASAGLLIALLYASSRIKATISVEMGRAWGDGVPHPAGPGWIQRLRTSPLYRWVFRKMKWHIAPVASVVAILWVAATSAAHVVFNIKDSAGRVCAETSDQLPMLARGQTRKVDFPSSAPCFSTGLRVERWQRYEITLEVGPDWMDSSVPAKADGIEVNEVGGYVTRFAYIAAFPLKRVLLQKWFMPIARIGATGNDEYFLSADPEPRDNDCPGRSIATNLTQPLRRDGELFLYVNDAAIPFFPNLFYNNNKGVAKVTIRRVR